MKRFGLLIGLSALFMMATAGSTTAQPGTDSATRSDDQRLVPSP